MSTKEALEYIFANLHGTSKWQLNFFIELFDLIYSIRGRLTFQNLTRYSVLNESTFRRNFEKFFDWLNFNLQLIRLSGVDLEDEVIAAMDCSFISKSGGKTYGLDRFWSACLSRAVKGLELSLVCLIDVTPRKAWAVDAIQTPAGLSANENDEIKTRMDFYLQQIQKCKHKLRSIKYFVGDGFYAKTKVFTAMAQMQKHFITKLRPDANLRYLYEGPHQKRKGAKRKYAGKVDFYDLSRWHYLYNLEPHIEVYSVVVNSPNFKRDLKVVMLLNTKTYKHVLLACTDPELDSLKIIDYYRLRFKIEFLFRDVKQFTGLNHCQARSEAKLNFHFNLSLAAVNMANFQMQINPTIMSMNTIKRMAYNARFANFLLKQLSPIAEIDFNSPSVQQAIHFGRMWT